jgi:photosystem II stability/assembly factor-like uncharacterized protein
MKDAELEGRLRQAAATYERAAPHIPDLERRIWARIATTPIQESGGRRSWQFQLIATAAVLAFALGVAVLIRDAKLDQPPQPGKPRTSLVITDWYGLTPIGFTSAERGWALTGNTLLMTRDGGQHWRDASPPGTSSSCCAVYFLDASRGWAAGGWFSPLGADGLPIFKTVDGGNSWKLMGSAGGPSSITSSGPPTLDFVDEQHGWLIYWASSTNSSWIGQVQRTSDGGITWTWPTTLPTPPSAWNYGTLQLRAWIHFIDPSTGWFIGQGDASYNAQQLYVTHDGGDTWQPQPVPMPVEVTGADNRIGLPMLVNDKLVLPITLADGRVLLDSSNDRGSTWKMELPAFARGTSAQHQGPMAPTFVGNGVIALVLGDQIELNTGTGWTSIQPNGVGGTIVDIEFVSAKIGWLLRSVPSCPSSGCQFNLLKTTDGGHNWSQVSP